MVRGGRGALVAVSLVGALFAAGCTPEVIPGQTQAAGPGGTRIQVAEVRRGSLAARVLYSGNVQARQQVTVAPRTAGRILSLPVDVGSVVKAGDALVELDRATQSAQVAQAQGALDAAEARLRSLEAGPRVEQVAIAEARLAQVRAGPTPTQVSGSEAGVRAAEQRMNATEARYTALLGSRGSSLTEAQRDADLGVNWEQMKIAEANLAILNAGSTAEQIAEALASVDAAREQLALAREPATEYDIRAARATALQTRAALDAAQAQLAETTIRAPFDGVVAQRLLVEGAMATTATPILTLISTDLDLVVSVEEAGLAALQSGQEALVTASAYPGREFKATVASVAPVVDSRSRSVQVKLTAADEGGRLRDGMFVQAQLDAGRREARLLVPGVAIGRGDEGGSFVLVVESGKVRRQPVSLGGSDGQQVEVVSGLAEGQRVATSNVLSLRDGDAVTAPAAAGGAQRGEGQRPAGGPPGGASATEGQRQPSPQPAP